MSSPASIAAELVAARAQPCKSSEDRERTIRFAANLVTAVFAALCVLVVSAASVILGLS